MEITLTSNKFPCSICKKNVRGNAKAVCCDICDNWVHIKCNSITHQRYAELTEPDNDETFYCNTCINTEMPFGSVSNDSFIQTNILGLNNENDSNLENLNFKLSKNEKQSISHLSNLILQNNDPNNENTNFCKYYTIDQFCSKKFNNTQNFSIFHLNTHSLQYHKTDLDILLDSLRLEFDIIAISETRLQKGTAPVRNIDIPNYQYEHTPTEANKGGTLLYISDKLNYKPRKDLEIYNKKQIESTFVEILNEKGKNIIVGCIYKHHTITQNEFIEILSPLLMKISKEKKICYLAGDFNMNLLHLEKDPEIEKYFDLLTNNKFMPLVTSPTRIAKSSKTLIDNIFYNQFSNDIISGNLTVGISDHMPQFALIPNHPFQITKNTNKNKKKIRKYKQVDSVKFNQDLERINWSISQSDDVNQYGTNFLNVFEQVLNVHAPLTETKVTRKKIKQKSKPWINNGILKLIKNKDKSHNKFLKEKNQVKKDILFDKYKQQKNEITKLIRSSKKLHYNEYFASNSKNIKKLWSGINQIINKTNKANANPVCIEIDIDGNITTITEPKQIANAFNDHYTSVANQILKKRKYSGKKEFHAYLKSPNSKSFMIKPTTPEEIEDIITKLDISKSVGPNSIPNQLIKLIKKSISIPLANMFNSSFINGTCPEFLKISIIIPIYKKDSKLIVSNYRPISLLSNINKILEKLMFNRLYSFLETNKCIYDLQFGFRKKHSTNHALLNMTQQIRDTIDNGNIAIGVFVDFQKAFDTVNHKILLRKLEHYGIRGIANNWFSSYLSKRRQFVSIGGTNSETLNIEHGVPQGSVLGPLLFLIYINDLHTCIKHSTTRHFADDTNLLYTIDYNKPRNRNLTRNLNKDLKSLNHWLLANKITLNSAKTEVIMFKNKRTPAPNVSIKLNGISIERVDEVKYVGILFDEHLTFKGHIKVLNAKLKRANNLLAISRHYVPKKLLLQIYYGQFFSHLSYGCQLWGQNPSNIAQTTTLQKKAVRLMSFAHFQAHSTPLFKDLDLLKLTEIIKTNNIIFTHSTLNDNNPSVFKDYFKLKHTDHNHRTVNNLSSAYSIPKGSIELPQTKTAAGKASIKYICSINWNSTLKELSRKFPQKYHTNVNWLIGLNCQTLKHILKNHFLEQY